MNFYNESSEILRLTIEKKSSVKNLIYSSKYKNKKKLQALIFSTLRFHKLLNCLAFETNFHRCEKKLGINKNLLIICIYEFFFGNYNQLPEKFKILIEKHKSSLNSQLARLKLKHSVTSNQDLLDIYSQNDLIKLPRYVRVNTLKGNVKNVVTIYEKFGWKKITLESLISYEKFLETVKNLKDKTFCVDPIIPHLLIFPPSTSFNEDPLFHSGEIILQDKASCLSSYALDPPPFSRVLDCCAAPGNKTSHLAALMENKGKILAFDKDPKRFSTLQSMLFKAGVTCSSTSNKDFLSVICNEEVNEAGFALVDPSCSGSGMVDRLDLEILKIEKDEEKRDQRLKNLSNFQAMLLNSVLRLPRIKKVVYSTCSIHKQENEDVVLEALKKNKTFDLFNLFPYISSRGINYNSEEKEKKDSGEMKYNTINKKFDMGKCVRLEPSKDLTNGFFIACFVKNDNKDNIIIHNHNNLIKNARKKERKKNIKSNIIKNEKINFDEKKKNNILTISSTEIINTKKKKRRKKKKKKKKKKNLK